MTTHLTRFAAAGALALMAGAAGFVSIASADTAPTVNLTSTCNTSTTTSPIFVTAAFSSNIKMFGASNVSVTNGTASSFASSTGNSVFTFRVMPTATGTVTIQVPAGFASTSASSTGNLASNILTCGFNTGTTTPLSIVSITPVQTSGIADNVFADGWKWVIRFTVPTNEDAFRIRFSDWGNASNSFPANGNIRISSTQSTNASTTANGFIESGNGYSNWIYLSGDADAGAAGRQIDLTVEVKIPFGTNPGSYSSNFTAQTFPSSATSTATQ